MCLNDSVTISFVQTAVKYLYILIMKLTESQKWTILNE